MSSDDDIFKVFTVVSYESTFQINKPEDLPCVRRPGKSPPLLAEIVHILELTCHPMQPEVVARATVIRDSNLSLSAPSRLKGIRSDDQNRQEPSLSILRTLSNLKRISEVSNVDSLSDNNVNVTHAITRMSPNSRFYDECLYYLTAYGNHDDILAFLVKHKQVRTALKYVHYQNVDAELFISKLFLPYLRKGHSAHLVQQMIELDETLFIWKPYIIPLCAHLERAGLLNCLYLLQMLFKDPIRASMTCVRFYEKNCTTYTDLLGQAFHLVNAEMHLTKELDLCQWEDIRVGTGSKRKTSMSDGCRPTPQNQPLLMKMDSKTLNGHINTIGRQLEVTKFLANCEQAGRETAKLLPKVHIYALCLNC